MRIRLFTCGLAPFFMVTATVAMLQAQAAIAFNSPEMGQIAKPFNMSVIAAQQATASDFLIESSEKYKKGDL